LAKLGLEKNGEERIVTPTDGLQLLALLFEQRGIRDSTGRLEIELR
jgi:hypothetical protein